MAVLNGLKVFNINRSYCAGLPKEENRPNWIRIANEKQCIHYSYIITLKSFKKMQAGTQQPRLQLISLSCLIITFSLLPPQSHITLLHTPINQSHITHSYQPKKHSGNQQSEDCDCYSRRFQKHQENQQECEGRERAITVQSIC